MVIVYIIIPNQHASGTLLVSFLLLTVSALLSQGLDA